MIQHKTILKDLVISRWIVLGWCFWKQFILFIFLIVMMKFFHKSNSINLFKPQVNTLLNWKVYLKPPSFLKLLILLRFALLCNMIVMLKCIYLSRFIPCNSGVYLFIWTYCCVWDCQTTWAFTTRLLVQYCSQKTFESLRDGLIHNAWHLYKGGWN